MKLSRNTLSLLTVATIFAVLAAGVGWRLLAKTTSGDGGPARFAEPAPAATTGTVDVASAAHFPGAQPVRGASVIRDTLWIPVPATGEARANRRSEVATRVAGVVERVFVRENDLVRQGDLLVQLDTAEAAMEIERAAAHHLTALVDYGARMLAAGEAIELLDDEARAERERRVRALSGLSAAEVTLEQARRQIEFTRVRAPFTGRVANLKAVEGAYLNAGAEVLTLLEMDPIRIEAEVMESEIGYLEPGRRAAVRFTSFSDESFVARVESVNPIVDSEARSARVTLIMPNPGHRIRPGMYARVVVDAQAYPNRVLVPREAVVERNRRSVVFVARDANAQGEAYAEWRWVTTGFRNPTHVEIVLHEDTDMVEPGEIVLVDGHHYLAHDTAVRLVDDVRAAGGRPGR
jgi:membrane fusion protein, multidrug efflux system